MYKKMNKELLKLHYLLKAIRIMIEYYSNYNKSNIVDTFIANSYTVCTLIMFFSTLSLFVLSFIWSIHLIFSVINERKNQKYLRESKNSTQKEVWDVKIKNCERKIVKHAFLIAICTLEWIIMLSISSTMIVYYSRRVVSSKNFEIHSLDFKDTLYRTMRNNFIGKLLTSLFLILFSLLLILLRILTQYLCQEYSYFPSNAFKLAAALKRAFYLLLVIFTLGLFRYTIILQWISYYIIMVYEFVCFFKATKLLTNLLYKRYFDAKNHENQTDSVVTYYAWAYLEFKIGSCFIVTSFFFHVMSLASYVIFSIMWFFLTTENWPQVVFMNKRRHDYDNSPLHYQQINSFAKIYKFLGLVSFALGLSLLVIPYFIVSLTVLYRRYRHSFKKHEYQNPELIKALIDKHNKDYYFK